MFTDPISSVGGGGEIPAAAGPASPDSGGESPFRKMFGAYPMSDEEFKQFINQYLKDVISQFKEADARWKQAQDEMRKVIEGQE